MSMKPAVERRVRMLRRSGTGARPLGVPGVDGGGEVPGGDVVDVAADAYLGGELGCGEQAFDVGLDGGVRVGDGGGFEDLPGHAGCLGGAVPEGGAGEEPGAALGVWWMTATSKSLSGGPWLANTCSAR